MKIEINSSLVFLYPPGQNQGDAREGSFVKRKKNQFAVPSDHGESHSAKKTKARRENLKPGGTSKPLGGEACCGSGLPWFCLNCSMGTKKSDFFKGKSNEKKGGKLKVCKEVHA